MFTSSLPLLPPPATSLLPSLHDRPVSDTSSTIGAQNSLQAQQQQQQQQTRRIRGHPHAAYPRSNLAILAHEERAITQRKTAIATYGYSWLKPAGCAKTMLGRREEEIEREEVERQLREAELQEQNAVDAEDAEREAQLSQQRAREVQGEDVGADGERDLDEDVPDMDEEDADNFDDEGSDERYDDAEDDLDHSIPEGDSAWRYDTTRDPDTDSEEEASQRPRLQQRQSQTQAPRQNIHHHPPDGPINSSPYRDDIGEYDEDHDLDDEIPDGQREIRDLDDDVPEAGSDDGEWEHTDTELEESEMDISIMPPGVTAHHSHALPHTSHARQTTQRNVYPGIVYQQNTVDTGLRRTSGNITSSLPSSNLAPHPQTGARGLARSQNQLLNFTPDQFGSDFSVSALISTGHTNASPAMQQSSNSFSDATGPRRNLFGASRIVPPQNEGTASGMSGSQTSGLGNIPSFEAPQMMGGSFSTNASRQVSSGGLFTPSPQQQQNMQRTQRNADVIDPSVRTTRSGRRLLDRVIPPRRPGAA